MTLKPFKPEYRHVWLIHSPFNEISRCSFSLQINGDEVILVQKDEKGSIFSVKICSLEDLQRLVKRLESEVSQTEVESK